MRNFVRLGLVLTGLFVGAVSHRENDFEASERCYRDNQLDSAMVYITRAEAHYRATGEQDSLVLAYAHRALVLAHREGVQQALDFMQAKLSVVNRLPESSVARIAAYNRLGQLHVQLYEFDEAEKYFALAERVMRQGVAAGRQGVILFLSIAQMHLAQQAYALAEQRLDSAYRLNLTVEGADGLLMANIWQTRYYLHYYKQDYQRSLADGLEFERLVKLHFANDHPNTAKMHNSLADIYYVLHRYDEALVHQHRAVSIHYRHYQKTGDPTGISGAYSNLGGIYFGLHEYHLADQYLTKALTLQEELFGEYGPGIIETLVMLGSTKQSLGAMGEAEALFKRAYRLQQQYAPGNASRTAYIESYLGDFLLDAQRFAAASDYYGKAISRYKGIGEAHSYYALYAKAYQGKARAYRDPDAQAGIIQQQEALSQFRQFLPQAKSSALAVMNEISLTYLHSGNPAAALRYSDSLLMALMDTVVLPSAVSAWYDNLPYRDESCEYLVNRAAILLALARQTGEKRYLQQLLAIVDGYGRFFADHMYLFRTQGALIGQAERNKKLYAFAIEACWELAEMGDEHDQNRYLEQAFMYAEWGKALLLRLASNNLMVDVSADPGDPVAARDRDFRRQISSLNEQYLNTDAARDSLLVAMTRQMEAYRLFQDSLRFHSNHAIFQKKYAIEPFSLKEIRKALLRDKQTLLQYAVTDSSVFVFMIASDQFRVKRMDKSVLEPLAGLKNLHALSAPRFTQLAYRLYQGLIAPVKPHIVGSKLLIVPDGELFHLNFELLVSSPDGTRFRDLPYLIRNYEISYLLSASSAMRMQKPRTNKTNGKGLVMVPVFDDEMKATMYNSGSDPHRDDHIFRYLNRQPFALRSGQDIAGYIPSDLYTAFDAQESVFKRSADRYQVLHLGTHAQTDDVSPLHSRLFFAQSPVNDSLATEDGLLYAYEVYNLQLRAELAVLTACETGDGRIYQGEGMISLAYSFLYAGCASVVMSLWEIDEKTTADVITLFYEQLSQGAPKSSALRLAKLAYLDNTREAMANPYYWAGLGLIGDTAPVYSSPLSTFLLRWDVLIAGAIMLIIISWYVVRLLSGK